MNKTDLKNRTKKFALEIIKMIELLPNKKIGHIIANQILRSSTSVAANYRAACRGRSQAEFIAKLGIVLEEADESQFWLELIIDAKLLDKKIVEPLYHEADELVAIFVSSTSTTKQRKS